MSSAYLGTKELPVTLVTSIELCHFSALEAAGQSAQALEGLQFLLEKSRKGDLKLQEARAHLNIGQLLSYQNQYSESLKHLLEAKTIFTHLNVTDQVRITLNSIAVLYGRMGQHEQALEYFAEVLEKNRLLNKNRNVAVVLYNMGRRYEDLGHFEKSLAHFKDSLKIHRELGNKKSMAVVERSLGGLYNSMNQPEKALPHLKSAADTLQSMNLPKSLAQVYLELGRSYSKMGKDSSALENLELAHQLNKHPSSLQLTSDIHEGQSRIFAKSGFWKQAYTKLLSFKEASDQIHRVRSDEQLRQLNFKFDLSKKEEANKILKAQNQMQERELRDSRSIQRLQLMSLSLATLLLTLTAVFTIRQIRTARRMRDLALTDELTRIPNRRHILDFGVQALSTCHRQNDALSVVIFDIDHFKRINDTFGHAVGGEEFLAVLPFTDPFAAKDVAERIRRNIASCDFTDLAPGLNVTVSAGVSCHPASAAIGNIDSLIHQADEALYSVKQNGRNAVSLRLVS